MVKLGDEGDKWPGWIVPRPSLQDARGQLIDAHVHEIRMRCIEAAVAGVQSGEFVPSEAVLEVARRFADYVLGPTEGDDVRIAQTPQDAGP